MAGDGAELRWRANELALRGGERADRVDAWSAWLALISAMLNMPASDELIGADVAADAAPLEDDGTAEAPDDVRCAGDGGASANAEVLTGAAEDAEDEEREGAGDFVRGDGEGAANAAGRAEAAGAGAGDGAAC